MQRSRPAPHYCACVNSLRLRSPRRRMHRAGLGSMAAMHAERLRFRQGGALDRGMRNDAAAAGLIQARVSHVLTRRIHSLLCIGCVLILRVHANTITVVTTPRKAHGLQGAPEALAVLLPRALNDAVLQMQHFCASLLEQGNDEA